jgi:hypothetical protein
LDRTSNGCRNRTPPKHGSTVWTTPGSSPPRSATNRKIPIEEALTTPAISVICAVSEAPPASDSPMTRAASPATAIDLTTPESETALSAFAVSFNQVEAGQISMQKFLKMSRFHVASLTQKNANEDVALGLSVDNVWRHDIPSANPKEPNKQCAGPEELKRTALMIRNSTSIAKIVDFGHDYRYMVNLSETLFPMARKSSKEHV